MTMIMLIFVPLGIRLINDFLFNSIEGLIVILNIFLIFNAILGGVMVIFNFEYGLRE